MNIKKVTTIATVIFIVLVLVVINIYNYKKITFKSKQPQSVIGTYCTGDEMNEKDEYFTFMDDNSYIYYKQFKVLDEGNYETSDIGIITLTSSIFADNVKEVVFGNKSIYLGSSYDGFQIFIKISDTPVLINIR